MKVLDNPGKSDKGTPHLEPSRARAARTQPASLAPPPYGISWADARPGGGGAALDARGAKGAGGLVQLKASTETSGDGKSRPLEGLDFDLMKSDVGARSTLERLYLLSWNDLRMKVAPLGSKYIHQIWLSCPKELRGSVQLTRLLLAMSWATGSDELVVALAQSGRFDWAMTDDEILDLIDIGTRVPMRKNALLGRFLYHSKRDTLEHLLTSQLISVKDVALACPYVPWWVRWKVIGALDTYLQTDRATKEDIDTSAQIPNVGVATMNRWFLQRFGDPMVGAENLDKASMDAMWSQLAALPERDVAENPRVTEYGGSPSSGGAYSHGTDPLTGLFSGTVIIGRSSPRYVQHTVRHEIGHSLHEANGGIDQAGGPVNDWLINTVHFEERTWDEWITELGGYPIEYSETPDGPILPFDAEARTNVQNLIRNATGSGRTNAGVDPPDKGARREVKAQWAAMPRSVKDAWDSSAKHPFYEHSASFSFGAAPGCQGYKYFVNHYYQVAYRFGDLVDDVVKATGGYASMSPGELFAECYAEHYEDPQWAEGPEYRGGRLPPAVKAWFENTIHLRPLQKP